MTVNPQITDAVSSPGNVVEEIDYAHAKAAADAVAAQQQFYVLAQAATTQSVTAMLSIDTSATAVEVKKDLADAVAAVQSHAPAAAGEVPAEDDEMDRLGGIARDMNALGEAYCRNLMRVVQIAATSACLTAMIAEPDEVHRYRQVLEAIKSLV